MTGPIGGLVGVAISTTGHAHRMGFLETCVNHWRAALPLGSVIIVTVDGSEADAEAARRIVDRAGGGRVGGNTYRVGQRVGATGERLGVAVSKNTGIELLMDAGVKHLFLSDDDCWPLMPQALTKHIDLAQRAILHSMVCWGGSRLDHVEREPKTSWAVWKWPRGVMLYAHRIVIDTVGGMDERFGVGGHEHAEWSRRIGAARLTPDDFVSPASYAERGPSGTAMRAQMVWHCEDMRRPGEGNTSLSKRRKAMTTIRRTDADWTRIHAVMAEREGSSDFVAYTAAENGRASATLCTNLSSRGAEGEK